MVHTITAGKLSQALDLHGQGISVLSLDCFDTLIWRSTATPIDVFADLDAGIRCRTWAESIGRVSNQVTHQSNEITLREIHQRLVPDGAADAIKTAVAAELAAEASHCFAFAPAVELIKRAHSAGIKVIVVSDTYLSADELAALIARVAGEQLLSMICAVFCSSDFGISKSNGLFRNVLGKLGAAPDAVLHIGDNRQADVDGANRAGIRAIHLIQFDSQLEQQLRLEVACGLVMDPKLRVDRAIEQMHRATLAQHWSELTEPAQRVGFGSLGPILHGFSHWILAQAQALSHDRQLNMLFLLRDGYMPMKAFDQLPGSEQFVHTAVELSRYASYAASFVDEPSIVSYLAELSSTGRFDALANQLLFLPGEARALQQAASAARNSHAAFVAQVRQPDNLRKILDRSQAYRARLLEYIRRTGKVRSGQTVVFVDLGYAGTVQDRLAPILKRELDVDVLGRYLLLRDVPGWRRDKLALMGPDYYDGRSLDALAAYVAIVEQMCTVEQASVIDYDEYGAPIRKRVDMKSVQSQTRAQTQAASLQYIHCYPRSFHREPANDRIAAMRTSAYLSLSRLLYMPSNEETELFDGFEHDVNLGVNDKVTLFNSAKAKAGMVERGLFYTNDHPSQFLPAELRNAGMPTSLSLLLLRRFAPDLRYPDFEHDGITLPIMIADSERVLQHTVTATATHDGYYLATVPIGARKLSIGLSLGKVFEWVQIQSATLVPVVDLMTSDENKRAIDVADIAVLEDIEKAADGLLHCGSVHSFLFLPTGTEDASESWVLCIVFRPIARRCTSPILANNQGELITQSH